VVTVAAVIGIPVAAYLLLHPLLSLYYHAVRAPRLPTWGLQWSLALYLVYLFRVVCSPILAEAGESPAATAGRCRWLALVSVFSLLLAVGTHLVVGLQTYSLLYANSAAAGLSFGALWFGLNLSLPTARPPPPRHVRGRRILTLEQARAQAAVAAGLPWGGVLLPPEEATTHFMVVGTTGSGKTVTIRALMKAVLPGLGRAGCRGALIYDAKRDVVSVLAGLGLTVDRGQVALLNPFDRRCSAWDMAADVTTNDAALEVATALCPREERASNPYFADAARDIVEQVIRTFIQLAPGRWTLRDVLVAADNEADLVRVLRQTDRGRNLLDQHARAPATWGNILGSLSTKLRPYHVIGALWHRAGRQISLESWFAGGTVLVLGSSQRSGEALRALNRVLFKRLAQIAIDQQEDQTSRRWFFIDEAKDAGNLDGLDALLTKGRSKGMCVVLGFQDTEGMQEAYGDHPAMSLIGQPSHRAILRMGSPETAKWAVSVLGEVEVLELRATREQAAWAARQSSASEQREKRDAVLASEITDLALPDRTHGPEGIYLSPRIGAYRSRLRWDELDLPVPHPTEPNYEENVDPVAQELGPWAQEDLKRLGLAELPPVAEPLSPPPAASSPAPPATSPGAVSHLGPALPPPPAPRPAAARPPRRPPSVPSPEPPPKRAAPRRGKLDGVTAKSIKKQAAQPQPHPESPAAPPSDTSSDPAAPKGNALDDVTLDLLQ
jgi:hypothetical protein